MASSSHGTLYQMGSGTPASPGTYTTIPEVTGGNLPEVNPEFLESTSHDSGGGFKEWVPGLKDAGTIPLKVWWNAANVTHEALRAASFAATLKPFKAILPGAPTNGTWTFNAYVAVKVNTPQGQLQEADLGLRVTGLPGVA